MAIFGIELTGANADAIGIATPTLLKPDYRILAPDAIGISDARSTITIYARLISDTIGLSDSAVRQSNANRIVSDAFGLSDTVARQSDANRIVSDAIGLFDSPVFQTDTRRSVADAIGVADSAIRSVTYLRIVTDALALGDTVTIVAVGPSGDIFLVTVTDSLGLATTHSVKVDYRRAVTDSIGIDTTHVANVPVYARAVTDAIGFNPSTIDHNLIINYAITEGSGTTITDSQNGATGTLSGGATWVVDGTRGPVLSFDGVNGQVESNNESLLDFGDYLTVACWVKPAASSTRNIFSKYGGTADGWLLTMGEIQSAGGPRFFIANTGVSLEIESQVAFAIGSWNHVAATYDKDIAGQFKTKLYINGVEVAVGTTASGTVASIGLNNYSLMLGRRSGATTFFSGQIDDVQIYRHAFGSADVLALYRKSVNQALTHPDAQVQVDYHRIVTDAYGIADASYRSVVYARLISDVLALGDSVVIASGPAITLVYGPLKVTGDFYVPGATSKEVFVPGATSKEIVF